MKKVSIILHAAGFIGGIFGAIGLYSYGWTVYQWPIISCLWIVSSFISGLTIGRLESDMKILDIVHEDMRDQLVKTQTALHREQLGQAKN